MRILLDGEPVEILDPKIARRVMLSPDRPAVDGVVMSADEVIEIRTRNLRLAIGFACGFGAAIAIAVLIGLLASGSRELVLVAPVDILALVAIGVMWRVSTRRREAKVREEAPRRLARMAPPGTALVLDDVGLAFAGRVTPWSDIAIEAAEIACRRASEGPDDYVVDGLVLAVEGRQVVLDSQVMTNGQAIVDKALRALDAPWARPDKGIAKVARR
jgi:hypothetical protein